MLIVSKFAVCMYFVLSTKVFFIMYQLLFYFYSTSNKHSYLYNINIHKIMYYINMDHKVMPTKVA